RAASSYGRRISNEVTDDFESERAEIEARLDEICEAYLLDLPPAVSEAISYGLKSPGKRLRPVLVLLAYRAAGGKADGSLLACALEVVHSYSLVRDDLPCMDDDDVRRGMPTVHKVYGSRVAIVGGVAMIPMAVRVARDASKKLGLPSAARAAIVATLLEAAGAGGTTGRQQPDLSGERLSLALDRRWPIHPAPT